MLNQEREKIVLKYIIERHIETGAPVGSGALAQTLPIPLSAASVRNIMAELEKQGYLHQPYPSAGRVPTDSGYRLYVNEMIDFESLQETEQQQIASAITELTGRIRRMADAMEEILLVSSRTLAQVSQELGMALAPRFNFSIFDRINLYRLNEERVLVELSLASGIVKTVIWDMDLRLSAEELQQISRSLNERLNGLSVEEIRRTLRERLGDLPDRFRRAQAGFVQLVLQKADELFNFEQSRAVNVFGADNILAKPDFTDQQEVRALITFIENAQQVQKLLHPSGSGIRVTIGRENPFREMSNCAVITANYQCEGVTGTVGILGPKRMAYARLIPLVLYTANTLDQTLNTP